MSKIERFDIPTQRPLIDIYRAFRANLEKVAEAKGEKLDPSWYADSPDEKPGLYKDRPE
jgi:hypothetical protein